MQVILWIQPTRHCIFRCTAKRWFHAKEWDMVPEELINQLDGSEKAIFRRLYAGNFARKIYRMYEYIIVPEK
ncbi:MAG: hypothetical protein IJ410_05780 [Oscillospiraceae bacterium]|nr:hypothetical protein [Oscillospiraceae bacterium]